jgi:hypothetical protein
VALTGLFGLAVNAFIGWIGHLARNYDPSIRTTTVSH